MPESCVFVLPVTESILTRLTGQSRLHRMRKQTSAEKIIRAAEALMVAQGYTATTVDEIVAAAGVAKGSFYHAYKSKEELAMIAMESYYRRGMAIVSGGPYREEKDPVKRVLKFLDYVDRKAPELWEHGCMLGSMSVELEDKYPNLIAKIDALFTEMENDLKQIFAPALKARGVRKPTALELARHLVAVFEGSIIMSKSHRDPKCLGEGFTNFRRYFQALVA